MDKLISPPNYLNHACYERPAFPRDAVQEEQGVRASFCPRAAPEAARDVSPGLKCHLFLAGRCCKAVTPACHAKNAGRECSASSQISLENRNTGCVQLIFQGKRTSPRPALRKPRTTRDGGPRSLAPKQQTRAEQRRGHKRKPCTDPPPNITQEGAGTYEQQNLSCTCVA